MNDTKITMILMNMATIEDGLAKGHEANAKLLRELASEIELPGKPEAKPKPTPKTPFHVEVVPLSDTADDAEVGKAVIEWLRKLQDITARPTSWPF